MAINYLCFKNSYNKKLLGNLGFVKLIVRAHKRWAATEFNL